MLQKYKFISLVHIYNILLEHVIFIWKVQSSVFFFVKSFISLPVYVFIYQRTSLFCADNHKLVSRRCSVKLLLHFLEWRRSHQRSRKTWLMWTWGPAMQTRPSLRLRLGDAVVSCSLWHLLAHDLWDSEHQKALSLMLLSGRRVDCLSPVNTP